MLDVKLIVVGGHTEAKEFGLQFPAVIGRGRDSHIVIPHPLVSRRHCEIFVSNGLLYVRDLSSLNGTYVGRERITVSALPPGGLLTVGTVTFRAVYATTAEMGLQYTDGAERQRDVEADGETVLDRLRNTHVDGFDCPTDRVLSDGEASPYRPMEEKRDTERSDWDTES